MAVDREHSGELSKRSRNRAEGGSGAMTYRHHYAVVVGIDHYPGFTALDHARSDAAAFANWLKSENGGGLVAKHVELITDPQRKSRQREKARPVDRQVWQALDSYRQKMDQALKADPNVFEQSRLYFFVSGHGIAPSAGDAALLMADSGRGYYDLNISCREILDAFELRQCFKELVFFADCCRQPDGVCRPGRPPFDRQQRDLGGVRKFWGYATRFQDVALEPTAVIETELTDGQRHGYFSRALLEALDGKAGEQVDSASLKAYVVGRVVALTEGRQTPQMPVDDPIVFRAGKGKVRRQVRIHFPPGYSGTVRLTRGLQHLVGTHRVNATPWVLDLEDELYRVQPGSGNNAFANGGMFAVEGGTVDVRL